MHFVIWDLSVPGRMQSLFQIHTRDAEPDLRHHLDFVAIYDMELQALGKLKEITFTRRCDRNGEAEDVIHLIQVEDTVLTRRRERQARLRHIWILERQGVSGVCIYIGWTVEADSSPFWSRHVSSFDTIHSDGKVQSPFYTTVGDSTSS
jgi:hypothetical protein